MQGFGESVLIHWKKNAIFDKASVIFNCDETGFPFNPKCARVVDKAGTCTKNPSFVTGGDKYGYTHGNPYIHSTTVRCDKSQGPPPYVQSPA